MNRAPRPNSATIEAWQRRHFGMFIHWGLYSLLGGVWQGKQVGGYNEQIQAHARIPRDEYTALAAQFNPVKWDPDAVVALARAAGMKFVVLTSKHHDGFSLFHTARSPFNVVDATPFGKDIVAGLAEACHRGGIGFGVYFSTIDWNFEGATPIDYDPVEGVRNDNVIPEAHAQFNAAQLTELMTNYGPISEVWFDMGKPTLHQSQLFADTVHRHQPQTMVSGRVFNYQGDFTVMGDNEIPPYPLEEPWQSPASIYHETWGYRSWQAHEKLEKKVKEHLANLVHVVSRGGNYLLNIGPRGDGSIVEFEADVLKGIGAWLSQHSEAIEDTESQPFRYLEFGAATVKGNRLYLFILDWPVSGELDLPGLETEIVSARFLGQGAALATHDSGEGKKVVVGKTPSTEAVPVVELVLEGTPIVQQIMVHETSVRLQTIEQGLPHPRRSERGRGREVGEFEPASQSEPSDALTDPTPLGDGMHHGSVPLSMTEPQFVLEADQADSFFHRNGYGYSDPPKLYKLRWNLLFEHSGRYTVTAEFESGGHPGGVEVRVGDAIVQQLIAADGPFSIELGHVEILRPGPLEVSITPFAPFEKGTALGPRLRHLTLQCVNERA